MPERLERFFLRVLQFGLPLAFLTPLVYIAETTFPFVVGKVWTFRTLLDLLLPFYAGLLLVSPRFRPKSAPLQLAMAAYLGALVVAAVFGVDPQRSFWSNHERMTGVVTLLHYGAFALMCATVYRTRKQWYGVLVASLAASVVMTVIALWERTHPGFLANSGNGRVWATLGNYIYLANYLLFHLYFLALLVFARARSVHARIGLAVIALMEIAVMLFTQTRGTLLALIVAGVAMLAWIAIRDRKYRAAGAGILLAGSVLAGILYVNRAQPWVHDIPTVGKLLNTTLSEGGGVRTRFIAWEIALQAFRDRPLTGYGPENFYTAFNLHYNPESYRYSAYETWFDRSHNTLLDVLSMTGALGAVAYVALFAAAFWTIERKMRAGELRRWEGILTGGMLIAYVVQNLTVFDSHTSYLYFFLLLAFIAWRPLPETAPPLRLGATVWAGTALVAIFGVGFAVYANVLPYEANRLGLLGTSVVRLRGDAAGGMEYYNRALALPTPHKTDLRLDGAREIAEIVVQRQPPEQVARPALEWAITRVEENRAARTDVYDAILLAQLLVSYASYDSSAVERARIILEDARTLSPDRQQLVFALVQVALYEGRADDAVALLEESARKEEKVKDVHWNLALAYQAAGNLPGAARAIARARELGYQWTGATDVVFAVQVYRGVGDYANAAAGAELLVRALPKEAQAHLLFAQVLADMGEKEKARSEAELALTLDASLSAEVGAILAQTR